MFEKISSSDIALIAAVVSPVAVVLINTFAQNRKDKNIFYFRHQCEVVETYLKTLGQYIYTDFSKEAATNYGIAHAEIYMYIPQSLWFKIDNMDLSIGSAKNAHTEQYPLKHSEARVMYEELCKVLSPLSRNANWFVRKWRIHKLNKKFSNLPPNKKPNQTY